MARVALVALVFVALLLSSCSRRTLLIISDQYWKASTLAGGPTSQGLKRLSEAHGVKVETKVVDYQSSPMGKLVGIVESAAATSILLSPLYSTYAPALAAHFSDRRFIAFSRVSTVSGPANLSYLVSDPTEGFTEAANRVVAYLASAGRANSPGSDTIIGVFGEDSAGQNALAAFRRGLQRASSPPSLSVIQVASSADRSRLRSFLEESRGKGVAVYLLAAPALDSFALSLLRDSTVPIVAVDWRYGATYSDKVLFSIDEDIPTALMKILEQMGRPTDKEIRIPWDIVAGAKGS